MVNEPHSGIPDASNSTTPKISVIIPTFNRRRQILSCIGALSRQEVDTSEIEVIVVDDGSTDGTSTAVTEAGQSLGLRVICVSQPNGGANRARNRGIELAGAPLLLIINDDTIATETLISQHLRAHRDHPDPRTAVLGRMQIAPDLPFSVFHTLHHEASFAPLAAHKNLHWSAFLTSNLSLKRGLLGNSHRFNEQLRWHEDIELGERLSHIGLRLIYNRDALAYHDHMLNEASFLTIADKEGAALAHWYGRRPQLLPCLQSLGFHSKRLRTREKRHIVADMAIMPISFPAICHLARLLSVPAPSLAQIIYRKLFQWRKRRAIDATLAEIEAQSRSTTSSSVNDPQAVLS